MNPDFVGFDFTPSTLHLGRAQYLPTGGGIVKNDRWGLRIVQHETVLRARQLDLARQTYTFVAAVPCTGKTNAALLAYWELRAAGKIRYIMYVVPNETLLKQAVDSVRTLFGHSFFIVRGQNMKDELDPENPFCVGVVLTLAMLNQPQGNSNNAAELWNSRLLAATAVSTRLGMPGGVLTVYDEAHHLADTLTQFAAASLSSVDVADKQSPDYRPWCAIAHKQHEELTLKNGGHSLLMTGTPNRPDGVALPIVERCYDHDPERNPACAGTKPASKAHDALVAYDDTDGDDRPSCPHCHIEVPFEDAYAEGALKMPEPLPCPAVVSYKKSDKEETDKRTDDESEDVTEREIRDRTYTALALSEYWRPAVASVIEHWRAHRKDTFDFWQVLGLYDNQRMAAKVSVFMLNELGLRVGLAISGTGEHGKAAMELWRSSGGAIESGQAALKGFKDGRYDVLSTVAMATEGYDVPNISHLIYLTGTRTSCACIQGFMRGCRACQGATRRGMRPQDQVCYVATPADSMAAKYLESVKSSLETVKLSIAKRLGIPDEEERTGERKKRIEPISAKLVGGRKSIVTQPTLADRAAADDARRRIDIKNWTSNAKGFARRLKSKHPKWESYSGRQLESVWRFVRESVR